MITDKLVDEIIAGIGQPGNAYYYDFIRAHKIEGEASKIITPVNNFLKVYQRLTGKTIGSVERLSQLLEEAAHFWNEESDANYGQRVKTQREEEEQGLSRDKVLPFWGVDLTKNLETFRDALRPLYIDLGRRMVSNIHGYVTQLHKMKPLFFGDKFEIKGTELITTGAHAEERDNKCKRYATTPEQVARVKFAVDFIKPFKEMEKHIENKEVVRKKSYVQELGLPYPVCLVIVSHDRKKLMPNPAFVEDVQLHRTTQKIVYQNAPIPRL